ncbi:SURF1 family protein [Bradyrhizobium sp. U87765 SZCCT0131]|uniref:SURF1 family protein n=1 Tax=unclassified Bradyrhizobium TaxID=2631580 RepID=UPI001BA742A0|nr:MULTISPECIES: SURF1 family protein [unclassified Bradyrhizobium]MBR1220989.1 SURF1 family protein [Bradyrhizobium sp. U87765 SZCCT0131]MBR1260191.1 SURF1 family protein [Bradyrhizobium sp. U87765 SZCCT0134]MBR1307560.1 SURF1 family protein [Bradyrhizobium sp. U87765 SZCCT0110]MBR1321514.1 SURF1 family protein [Bradyrhizobium sp. U87765 SZCCT0109]MBR1349827.1 SURF1 family protein [Bradyrhizobium sp. U87765 SZCCT0048]
MSTSTRGRFGMAIITVAMLVVLVGLGIWQLQRKQEKQQLIAALNERLAAAPVALPPPSEWGGLTASRDEFRRVKVLAQFDVARDARVYTSGSALRPDVSGLGTWVFMPARIASGGTMVVNRGFLPEGAALLTGVVANPPVELVGYLRFPESPGWFTPKPDVAKHLWFARDSLDMAQMLGWGQVAPFYLDLEGPVPPSGLPKAGPLDVQLRDQHLQYAMTWFGLAIVVAIAAMFWFRSQRRA